MKKMAIITAAVMGMTVNMAQADEMVGDEIHEVTLEQASNVGAGAIFGAALAGPFGAILGGITGNLLGEASTAEEQIALLKAELVDSKRTVAMLQEHNIQLLRQEHEASRVVLQQQANKVDFNPKGLSMSVQFRHNSSSLEPVYQGQLAEVAKTFAGMDHIFIQLAGHADRTGSDSYNYRLSKQRVHAVANALCAAGWPKHRLHISAQGERQPLGDASDRQGYTFDRRVGLVLTTQGAGI